MATNKVHSSLGELWVPLPPEPILIDLEHKKIFYVTNDDRLRWHRMYPSININRVLDEALAWCIEKQANPKDHRRFLDKWMQKAQVGGSYNPWHDCLPYERGPAANCGL